jgi:hypothetical protein
LRDNLSMTSPRPYGRRALNIKWAFLNQPIEMPEIRG